VAADDDKVTEDELDVSPYPPAIAARVPSEKKSDKLSAVLVPRSVGYLNVRVTFHKDPCRGLKVKLFETDDDGKKGAQVGEETKTKKHGIVCVPFLVPAGLYVCAIENQPETLVNTVVDIDDTFEVVTPVGRPYVDIDEDAEWADPVEASKVADEEDENATASA
jgi:hypothetical protein